MNHWDRIYETGAYKRQWDYKFPSQELVTTVAVKGVPQNGIALDVGCGAGRDAIFLAQCGYKVIAIDISEKAIEIAKERATEAQVEVEWRCGNVLELSITDQSVEFITDRGCFHLISENDRAKYAQEITRVLKPGGTLLLRGFGCQHAHGIVAVTQEQIDKYFPSGQFKKGPFLKIALVSDAGELEGNMVVMEKL